MEWKFNHIDFSVYPFCEDDDFGVFTWSDRVEIKLWAPSVQAIILRVYKSNESHDVLQQYDLNMCGHGLWQLNLDGNFVGNYYTLQICYNGMWLNEVPDIYARCVGANGKRGMFFIPNDCNPQGWENDSFRNSIHQNDAIIYETHIRDFTISENSGVEKAGKYLGFAETGTTNKEGYSTGVDHLKMLGITHVQLLPIFDFWTIDEISPEETYNWGYDPYNFNSPEGWYASNPHDGRIRIKELKELIRTLHDNNIGVVMDVVYNHTGRTRSSVQNQMVPGYFYRQNEDGSFSNASGCGNEIATERAMVRKYIIDSLKYWMNEYHIDGFRFDLMGIYDIDTMNQIGKELRAIRPDLLLYGEGWTADRSPMDESKRAMKGNARYLDNIGMFNDDFRDAIKGHWSNQKSLGFVSGLKGNEESLKFGIVGATDHPQIDNGWVSNHQNSWASSPCQSLNYFSCHDNYTFFDKINMAVEENNLENSARMTALAMATLLCSQGMILLHSGVEMMRTKGGNPNSYRSSDAINRIDWSLKSKFPYLSEYLSKLICLRKAHPAFRMRTSEQIAKHLKFSDQYIEGVVRFTIVDHANNDDWKTIEVVLNNNIEDVPIVAIQDGGHVVAEQYKINLDGLYTMKSRKVTVKRQSMLLIKYNK